jgi:hypothetical protein
LLFTDKNGLEINMKTLILAILALSLFVSNAQAGAITFKCDFSRVSNDEHVR